MVEVFGKCLSSDNNAMFILDDDGDKIEMVNIGMKEDILKYFKSLIGKRISYYYDIKSVIVQPISNDEPIITIFPRGNTRTLKSLLDQIQNNKKNL